MFAMVSVPEIAPKSMTDPDGRDPAAGTPTTPKKRTSAGQGRRETPPTNEIAATLRRRAREDDPLAIVGVADIAAWARAEGEGSDAEARAIERHDLERYIPGLPARRTFMAIGVLIVAAIVIDAGLSSLPPAQWIDTTDWLATDCVGYLASAAATWSILSEVRGWEGSDASTWFLKRRVKAFDKALDMRRRAVCETAIAIRERMLIIYEYDGGHVTARVLGPWDVDRIAIEPNGPHMSLLLGTEAGAIRFDWLERDTRLEAGVVAFAASITPGSAARKATGSMREA